MTVAGTKLTVNVAEVETSVVSRAMVAGTELVALASAHLAVAAVETALFLTVLSLVLSTLEK